MRAISSSTALDQTRQPAPVWHCNSRSKASRACVRCWAASTRGWNAATRLRRLLLPIPQKPEPGKKHDERVKMFRFFWPINDSVALLCVTPPETVHDRPSQRLLRAAMLLLPASVSLHGHDFGMSTTTTSSFLSQTLRRRDLSPFGISTLVPCWTLMRRCGV